ncbi:glycolipid transfer protein [Ramaria rubella]|nr:glycolipid transfer protein [Ramaria rubella]
MSPDASGSAPYFRTVKSFAEVPLNEAGVETVSFLDASDGLVSMFDLLGTGVFSFVQADLRKNIQGVREGYSKFSSSSGTLESLVKRDSEEGHRYATGCLLRLLRGLTFTCEALQNSRKNKTEELPASFRRAYDTVLRHHHSFVVRTVVTVAIKACPRRNDFYARIAQGEAQEELDIELEKWLLALETLLRHMKNFYESQGYGKV